MAIGQLTSPIINWWKEGKAKVNAIAAILDGTNATNTNATLAAMVAGLPTADPHVVGALWKNAGVLTVSAG